MIGDEDPNSLEVVGVVRYKDRTFGASTTPAIAVDAGTELPEDVATGRYFVDVSVRCEIPIL